MVPAPPRPVAVALWGLSLAGGAVAYAAPDAPAPEEDEEGAEVIEIHGDNPDQADPRARVTLDEKALTQAAAQDLAETVGEVAGVTLGKGTADATKPIVRGQPERRLLVLNDGIRHESQKWGPDHATEIDPFAAGQIAVVRGAAGAQYGPDAIGGVILVEPPPMREIGGVSGKALAAFNVNGLRPYGALRIDAVPHKLEDLALRLEGNLGKGANLRAPTYVLGNTASQTWNLGASARWRFRGGQLRLSWHHHDLLAGVFYGVRNATPDEWQAQLVAEQPVTAELWRVGYAIDRPRQQVRHDQATAHFAAAGTWGAVEAVYAFQLNHRQEFEQVRGSVEGPQYDFVLRTHSAEARYLHPALDLGPAHLEGRVGLQGLFQENVYRGLPLIPNFRSGTLGIYGAERLAFPRADLLLSARYDHLDRRAWLGSLDYARHVREGALGPSVCDEDGDGGASCPTRYDAGSLSVGGVVHVVPQAMDLKVDLSSASRFPNVDELYLLGSAPTFPVYARGTPDLGVETSWGGSLTLDVRQPWLDLELSAFGSYVHDYIYFAPQRGASGELRYDVTVRGAFPAYGYDPIEASFYGADGSLSLGPQAPVGLDLRGALVRGQVVSDGSQLVGTPADRLRGAFVGRPPPVGPLDEIELAVTGDLVARQSRVDPAADFAPAPDAYALLGLRAQARVRLKDRPLRFGVEATNLLNRRYRDYNSLLRYYADQPGRDVRVWAGLDF